MALGKEGMTRIWILCCGVLLGFPLVALLLSFGQGEQNAGSCNEPRRLTAAVLRHVITSLTGHGNQSIYWKSDSLAGVCGQLGVSPSDMADQGFRPLEFSVVEKKDTTVKPVPGDFPRRKKGTSVTTNSP